MRHNLHSRDAIPAPRIRGLSSRPISGFSTLAFSQVASPADNQQNASAEPIAGLKRMTARILIVDDDPDTAEQLVRFVAADASETRVVTESAETESTFEEFEPDLVLLDLHMPEPDGFEVLRRLQRVRTALGFLPVIVLTGDTGKSARNEALILGANDYLTKPLDRQEVVLRVRNLLRTRQLYTDLANTNQALEKALRKER
jgi:putative two-component system response regulator